jgi:autotransporter-associated beta strand protein
MMLALYGNNLIRTSTNDLNGGTLNVDFITAEATDQTFPTTNIAVLNFNGGALKATASGVLISSLTAAYVKTNGAIIDDNGNSVTIAQALQDDGTQIGGLTKQGAGTVTLAAGWQGNNTYYGPTLISGGTLALSGVAISNSSAINVAGGAIFDVSGAPGFVVESAQTLKGNGTVNGSLTVNGTLAPGASVGTLTFNNNLAVNGNLVFELNKSLAPSNDLAVVTGALTSSGTGTLTVNNLGPALIAGDKFTLFSQALPGGNTITIVPPSGVTLTNLLAVDGSIQVLTATSTASYPTNITSSVSGNTLTISWPATHLGWILQNQTNSLNVGLATNWVDIAGTASVTSTNLTINPATPTAFFRLRHP